MNIKKLVVFDWDGTLMDSLARIVACMQAAANDLAITPASESEIRNIVGLALDLAIQRLHPALDFAQVECMRQRYSHHYIQAEATPSPFFEGALEMIHELTDRQCWLSVATGKSRQGLARVFAAHDVEHLFVSSRCADESKSKPAPDMLLELIAHHELSPEQVVMIGDTSFDLEMAQRAGVDSLGVTWGAHSMDDLLQYNPLQCFDTVNALRSWLIQNTSL